jgi:hypothetical protein
MPTCGIKNCRDSRLFKGYSPLQLLCNWIGNRPQSATFHTATVSGNARRPYTFAKIYYEKNNNTFNGNVVGSPFLVQFKSR